ncbi:MAG: hypothetical protein QCI00_09405 [Candidatus Thermoplasmatota archaeon]|nr:hypothetical protein [Candidatus Thermoplasmatota archaeon]
MEKYPPRDRAVNNTHNHPRCGFSIHFVHECIHSSKTDPPEAIKRRG